MTIPRLWNLGPWGPGTSSLAKTPPQTLSHLLPTSHLILPTPPHQFLLTRRNPLFLLTLLLLILGIVSIARDTFHKLPSISFAVLGRPLLLPIFLQRARLARENIHGPLVGLVRSILDFGMKAPLSACSTAYSRASPIRTARQGIVSRCAGGDARDFRNAPHCFAPRTRLPCVFVVVSAPAWNERSAPCPREAGMPRGPEVAPAQRAQTKKRTHRPGRPDNNPALHRPWTATDASLQHWTRRRRIAPGTSRSRKIIISFI